MRRKIVLTGGPCAGKTTALNYLTEKLSDYGFSIIVMPEVPTLVINSGLDPRITSAGKLFNYFEFEKLLLETQVKFEDEIFGPALSIKGGNKQLLVCDRGCMDYLAYMRSNEFEEILRRNNWTTVGLRDERYDAVFHLVTAAEGKEEFYNLNNPARYESAQEAKQADERTRNAWLGHPHLKIIDNSTLFDVKMKRLLNAIRKSLGIPVALETERKFLVQRPLYISDIPCTYQRIEIEQVYLPNQGEEIVRLRKRGQGSAVLYYETKKMTNNTPISRIETERQISKEEYYQRSEQADPKRDIIRKIRICFLYRYQYFELDVFFEPERLNNLIVLEIELTEENDRVEIPDWLGKVTEVTDNPEYHNECLAIRRPTDWII